MAQQADERRIDAFIDQPSHRASAVDQRFIGQIIGREGLGGKDILEARSGRVALTLIKAQTKA